MPTKRPPRKQVLDDTTCQVLVRPDSGESITMAVAEFLREHAGRIAQSVIDCLRHGEAVTVTTEGGTYTIKLVISDEANRYGRFISPRAQLPARELTEAAPSCELEPELEAVG